MKDQRGCVLNDLEELGAKEFLVLTSQYIIEIFSCFLRHLPFYSSTFHQTNVESTQIRSEDKILICRIKSLNLLLEVDDHDEEEYSVVLTLGKRISFWLNISPRSFTDGYSSCRWASMRRSLWFCFSLWSARISKYIRFQRIIFELHLWGFLLVVVILFVGQVCDQLIQAMKNYDPWLRIVFV